MTTKAEHTKGPKSTAQFTPGPWMVNKQFAWSVEPVSHPDKPNKHICDVFGEHTGGLGEGKTELEANARLIATSPELLEALDNVTASLETMLTFYANRIPRADVIQREKVCLDARAAIRKARGESHA